DQDIESGVEARHESEAVRITQRALARQAMDHGGHQPREGGVREPPQPQDDRELEPEHDEPRRPQRRTEEKAEGVRETLERQHDLLQRAHLGTSTTPNVTPTLDPRW